MEFLAVPGPNDLVWTVRLQQGLNWLGKGLEGNGQCLRHECIPKGPMLEGPNHQVNRSVDRHHEPRHVRIGDGERLPRLSLSDEVRDDRTATGHDVAMPGATDHRSLGHSGLAERKLFRHCL